MPARPVLRSPGSDWVVEKVLTCIEQVPWGRVIAYGQIGAIVDVGPRQVGAVLAAYGGEVAWWRCTNSYGDLPAFHRTEAASHWAEEGIVWKPNRLGCRIRDFQADLDAVAAAYEVAIAERQPPEDD